MRIWINKQQVDIEQTRFTLQQLTEQLASELDGTALVVNDVIIPRSDWSKTALTDGDVVTLFSVIAGG
jgi:sulfur carrier protein